MNNKQLVEKIMNNIKEQAKKADDKALDACKRSKYSIQDYWLCIEFKFQQTYDDLARSIGLSSRCPVFPFRQEVNSFRKLMINGLSLNRMAEEKDKEHRNNCGYTKLCKERKEEITKLKAGNKKLKKEAGE